MKALRTSAALFLTVVLFQQCAKDSSETTQPTYEAVKAAFGSKLDLNQLADYANQPRPAYITKDNTGSNRISNEKATVGRVLFYDKSLSIDNTVSCGSCHRQELAFGDAELASKGVSGGLTGRHAMRLVNARFGRETKFFWDERASSLEEQATQPIKDHAEMGFSGQSGRPNMAALLSKLQGMGYYQELFQFAYGSPTITEPKLQECLAQFIRSIQSFDSRYDAGRALAANDQQNFANFTAQENAGKNLFLAPPVFDATGNRIAGGLGCNGCHNAPEFDIDPNTGNNGIIGVLNGTGIDVNNTRVPTLRDMLNGSGNLHTQLMHTGGITTLQAAIGHYGTINLAPGNNRLDPRLRPNGFGQKLNLTAAEVNSLSAFLKTLTGTNVYTDPKWSTPF
ncbi:cytochrome-c peroxidase [Hymenobacter yonginensis]|uniref:Cytochrome-c peroxidase n=1 Tax=Hymenobacter yonginensis TaxID=748197 RepID=A0ABY7PRR9_9BACT|nr:cytochrome c peroxidase [Hymenobacter yonginensis]WBO85538.1 cytochrome-c peroxidase [Hymenobacter yonginensis]